MIKVMIIEDEPAAALVLQRMIEKAEDYEVVSVCGTFSQAVAEYLACSAQVCFVDIDLDGESGLVCAKAITEINPGVKIIFATAHNEFMADAFEIYAFDYLVKPFDGARVLKTLQKISQQYVEQSAAPEQLMPVKGISKLILKSRERTVFLNTERIIFAEHSDGVTNVVTEDGTYATSMSLKELAVRLPGGQFLRCHKSYIANLSRIESVEPYGRWTYIVHFRNTEATALATAEKYEEIRNAFV